MTLTVTSKKTTPFLDQNPGTSGLRKKTEIFMQQNYTENFIQSIFANLSLETRKSGTLVIGGDGRYYCVEAAKIAIKIAAANQIKKIIICYNGLGSTPAISHLINKYSAIGAIILTASHNPGGPDKDFGIKFNVSSGGGAPEALTLSIFETTKSIEYYYICEDFDPDISSVHSESVEICNHNMGMAIFELEVIDGVQDYVCYMKQIFDFAEIRDFLQQGFSGNPIKLNIDGRNGIAGPYIHSIFCENIGCSENSISKYIPLKDFGGLHPDPNLTYGADFVEKTSKEGCDMGAAFDGDADRCMIIGSTGYYVSPSDSVAIIAANAVDCIPYFRRRKYLKGVARSMPTSSALDRVADVISLGGRELKCYEVPTGWKFFCNLMDADKVDICGEESFGAGSSHLREKDGIWVALAWLSIMARHKKPIKEIVINHWRKFGRHFYTRYDYENLSSVQGRDVMMQLQTLIDSGLKGTAYKTETRGYVVELADNFLYLDPIDNSLAAGQGYRIIFTNKDRLVVRLSGTGSCGSTIRLYMEHFETDTENIFKDTQEMLKDLIEISLEITKIKKFTTRDAPTVVS